MGILKYIVVIAIGALASMLANRGIAVFNDGFRAIVPQYYDGQISRKELLGIVYQNTTMPEYEEFIAKLADKEAA